MSRQRKNDSRSRAPLVIFAGDLMRLLFRCFSSLSLTVGLLALSVVLVFFGTLDQARLGVRYTQEKYFEGFAALWQYPLEWPGGEALQWFHLPIPGGYLLGPLLVLNLLAAHFRFFRPRWRNIGIAAIHAGVVLLLIGQLLNQWQQKDYFMWIREGESAAFLESFERDELVVMDRTAAGKEPVVRVPAKAIRRGRTSIRSEALPFRIEVRAFFENAELVRAADLASEPEYRADRGIGGALDLAVRERPPTYAAEERNMSTAILELVGPNNSIGTWLVSNAFDERMRPQRFEFHGRRYEIALRFKRRELPFALDLLEFSHDRYPGTDVPRNFSSLVRLRDPRTGTRREVVISMNHPLRYDGLTFYQASFRDDDTASMLQVVENPSRWIPYAACLTVSAGLAYQFGYVFLLFLKRRRKE